MSVDDFGIFSWVTATVYLLTVPAILGADGCSCAMLRSSSAATRFERVAA